MRVLIACEFSGIVREAFRKRGHDAWSCDLLPAEDLSPAYAHHMRCNVEYVLRPTQDNTYCRGKAWDLMIAHPPCTYLCNSGVRWLYKGGRGTTPDPERWAAMREAVKFFGKLWSADIPRVCIENPTMHRWARTEFGLDPSQAIQPWQFGHHETKRTCLWLRGLPKLTPTNIVEGRTPRVHHEAPSPERWKNRSRTLQGIADAMAEQWGTV